MKKNSILFFLFIWIGLPVWAQYKTLKDISYVPVSDTDAYRKERCKLDLYYPEQQKGFATIVCFTGWIGRMGERKFRLFFRDGK